MLITITLSNLIQVCFFSVSTIGLFLCWGNQRLLALRWLFAAAAVLMAFNFGEETSLLELPVLITPSFSLLEGPLFYWLICQLTLSQYRTLKYLPWHLLPALLSLSINQWPQLVLALGSISQVIYFTVCLTRLGHYQHATELNCSNAYDIQASWIKRIVWVILSLACIDALRHNLQPHLGHHTLTLWYIATQSAYLAVFGVLLITAVRRPELFEGLTSEEYALEQGSLETGDEWQQSFKLVEGVITQQQLYLQPRLRLADIAEHTGLNTRDISQAINTQQGRNFNEYINGLRLAQVEQYLNEQAALPPNQRKTLLEVALAAGFNSKSSFNAAFKRQHQKTPSEYLSAKLNN